MRNNKDDRGDDDDDVDGATRSTSSVWLMIGWALIYISQARRESCFRVRNVVIFTNHHVCRVSTWADVWKKMRGAGNETEIAYYILSREVKVLTHPVHSFIHSFIHWLMSVSENRNLHISLSGRSK